MPGHFGRILCDKTIAQTQSITYLLEFEIADFDGARFRELNSIYTETTESLNRSNKIWITFTMSPLYHSLHFARPLEKRMFVAHLNLSPIG